MKKGFCEIATIIDESGSMSSIATDAIGGFNQFLKEQKEHPGEAKFTLVTFDTNYNIVYDGIDISEISELDSSSYRPGGATALHDAIGVTIKNIGTRLSETPEDERPEKVIISILTDGHENASKEFNRDQINEIITEQKEKYNWEFIFLAANQDAIAAGTSMGIDANMSLNYAATGDGVKSAYSNLSSTVRGLRD